MKEKITLFSNHNRSLLRQRAGAKALKRMKGEDQQVCQRELIRYVPHQCPFFSVG